MVMGNRQIPGICGFNGLWHIRSLISGRNEKRLSHRERTNSIPVLSYKICLVPWSIYVAKARQQTTRRKRTASRGGSKGRGQSCTQALVRGNSLGIGTDRGIRRTAYAL